MVMFLPVMLCAPHSRVSNVDFGNLSFGIFFCTLLADQRLEKASWVECVSILYHSYHPKEPGVTRGCGRVSNLRKKFHAEKVLEHIKK